MKQEIITKGTRAVVISIQENTVWANLYVNASNGIMDATIITRVGMERLLQVLNVWRTKFFD